MRGAYRQRTTSRMTQPNSHPTFATARALGDRGRGDTRVITISSAAAADVHNQLCDALLCALADGAREIVLDLQGVELITSSSGTLMEAVGATLADRGGVLLVLTGGHIEGEPLVMREVRGETRERLPDRSGVRASDTGPTRDTVE